MKGIFSRNYDLGFGFSSPFNDIHKTADEPGQEEESARDREAHVVIRGRLKYPTWGTNVFLGLIDVFMTFTINRRADHWGESPEQCQEPEGAGEVVQAQ